MKGLAGFPDWLPDPRFLKQLEEMTRQMRQIERMGIGIGRDMQAAMQPFTTAHMRMIDEAEKVSKLFETNFGSKLMGNLQQVVDGLNAMNRSERRLIEDLTRGFGEFDWTVQMALPAGVAAFSALNEARGLDTVLSQFWENIPESAEGLTEEKIQADLKTIKDLLFSIAAKLPTSTLSNFLGIVGLILTVYQMYTAKIDTARFERKIDAVAQVQQYQNETLKGFAERFEHLETPDANHPETVFVALTSMNVRITSKGKAQVVGVLYPGQPVTLVEDHGKKLKIEYFDYLAGAQKTGWVLKKHMKRAEPAEPRS